MRATVILEGRDTQFLLRISGARSAPRVKLCRDPRAGFRLLVSSTGLVELTHNNVREYVVGERQRSQPIDPGEDTERFLPKPGVAWSNMRLEVAVMEGVLVLSHQTPAFADGELLMLEVSKFATHVAVDFDPFDGVVRVTDGERVWSPDINWNWEPVPVEDPPGQGAS